MIHVSAHILNVLLELSLRAVWVASVCEMGNVNLENASISNVPLELILKGIWGLDVHLMVIANLMNAKSLGALLIITRLAINNEILLLP